MKEIPHGYIKDGRYIVEGAVAEILSVLEESTLWQRISDNLSPVFLEHIYGALDIKIPHEERIAAAIQSIRAIRMKQSLGSWLPWYEALADHEYGHDFHEGYRDHTIHSLQVFLLGLYLYETITPIREALDRRLAIGADLRKSTPEIFFEWWALSSFWHDIGYIFEATNFSTDKSVREKQFASLSLKINEQPFVLGLASRGISLDNDSLRSLYRAGRYYPLEIQSVESLFCRRGASVVDEMWGRILVGGGLPGRSPVRELDRLTTQASLGRPPYHDHGILGALLLGCLLDEVELFLTNIAEVGWSGDVRSAQPISEEWWEEFVANEGIANLAMEAIAFHNFNTTTVDPVEWKVVFQGRQPVALNSEPHLFFLALADTLQNWDRHHFLPDAERSRYRPSVRSSEILLQGQGTRLAVSLKGEESPSKKVHMLFADWLSAADIEALIVDGARFTRNERVLSSVPTSIAQVSASELERSRLEKKVTEAVEICRRVLIEGGRDAVIETSDRIAGLIRQIGEASDVLTASDNQHVRAVLESSGLRTVEEQAYLGIQIGTRLPMGEIRRHIGSGGFGRVFMVSPDGGTEFYAFKLLHSQDLGLTEKRRLFRRGYHAMEALSAHPGVVKVFRYSEVPVGFYMKYISGPDLESGIKMLTTGADKLRVAVGVAEALAFAHSRGVLHRDIKPGNVILDSERDYIPVLTDFDLAWIDGRSQQTKAVYASVTYGAPEQLDKRKIHYTKKPTVDIYGLGALIYFLVTEDNPPINAAWTSENWALVDQRLEGKLPAVVVTGLRELVKECTLFSHEARPQSIDGVLAKLSNLEAMANFSEERLAQDAWLSEVMYRATGVAGLYSQEPIPSRTGGVSWRLVRWAQIGATMNFEAACTLNREPSFEGVNFEGFQRGTSRTVDQRIQEFRRANPGVAATRVGSLRGAGSEMRIKMENSGMTLVGANEVGQLLASISRMIE